MTEKYKGYNIDTVANEWGYYEAYSIDDCDAFMEFANSIEELKINIDELVDELND
jgi:hypothetical protein